MAISDALHDAATSIRSYLKEQPSWYAEYKERQDELLLEMDDLRIELDTPPQRQAR